MPEFDYRTTTPGSAVAQTLQEILARRRAESQQALLNKMAEEEQSARLRDMMEGRRLQEEQIGISRGQAAMQAELNKAQIADLTQRGLESQAQNVAIHTPEKEIQNDPLREYLLRSGRLPMRTFGIPAESPIEDEIVAPPGQAFRRAIKAQTQ